MKKRFIITGFLLLTLPILLLSGGNMQSITGKAAPKPANITIDMQSSGSKLVNSWMNFSQGGEEPERMIKPVIGQLKALSPRYIRIDHIFDYYVTISKSETGYQYDFSKLDGMVDDIIQSGALPFLTLSYMPSQFTSTGSVIDIPSDWTYWQDLIRSTVEHYSGKDHLNLKDVYYEVWNEPELSQFGSWKLDSGKDYRLLYFYAAHGADAAQNTNNYYFGGPAVGSYYQEWVDRFLQYIEQNDLRLDFYSWHRYTTSPDEYLRDISNIRNRINRLNYNRDLQIILSEWGIDSRNTAVNNQPVSASYTVNAITKFHKDLDYSFSFEIIDGPPPSGGQWGMFTHKNNPENSLSPKPKFKAFEMLSALSGYEIPLDGTGTYVTGMAAKTDTGITLVLSNYDTNDNHLENVPINFKNVPSSIYRLSYSYPLTDVNGFYELASTNGSISKDFVLAPNSLLLISLEPSAGVAEYVTGKSGAPGDQALLLKNSKEPFTLTAPEFRLLPSGEITFNLKPFWDITDGNSFIIFECPFMPDNGTIRKIYFSKQERREGSFYLLGIGTMADTDPAVIIPVNKSGLHQWHTYSIRWQPDRFTLTVDGFSAEKSYNNITIINGKTLKFYPVNAALDNLKITVGNNQTIERGFDHEQIK